LALLALQAKKKPTDGGYFTCFGLAGPYELLTRYDFNKRSYIGCPYQASVRPGNFPIFLLIKLKKAIKEIIFFRVETDGRPLISTARCNLPFLTVMTSTGDQTRMMAGPPVQLGQWTGRW